MVIDYLTEDPSKEYGKLIRSSRSLDVLLEGVREYRECAEDAIAKLGSMSEEDFRRFKKELPLMRKPGLGEKEVERLVSEWGDIVMPVKMMTASLFAMQYHAPWGLAYMRLEEAGWPMIKK